MYNNILVPMNGSERSRPALKFALYIAKKFSAKIIALCVYDDRLPSRVSEEAAKECKRNNVRYAIATVRGTPAREIAKYANKNADLVVMGERGKITKEVIKNVAKPLIVVKEKREIKKLLAAYDGSKCAKKALAHASELCRHLKAELTILHVFGVLGDYLTAEKVLFKAWYPLRKKHAIKALIEQGNAFEKIMKHAKNYDLIAIGARGHSKLKDIVFGSTAEKVMKLAACPVLILN
ncbi:MAG: universal stress protein [Euryarchaeota archaeon]|nr:universal stress protein [Euryarchaeota archaeon]